MMLGERTARGLNCPRHISSVTDVIVQKHFHQSHFKLRFKMHVKHTTKKQVSPSHDVKVSNCQFSTPELEDLPRKTSVERLNDKVRSVVTLDLFSAKNKDIKFVEAHRIVGWIGKPKTLDDDPKSSLKNKFALNHLLMKSTIIILDCT